MVAIRGKLLVRGRAPNRERAALDRHVDDSLGDGGLGAAQQVLRSAKVSRLQRARAHTWIALEDHDSSNLARAISIVSILATLTAIAVLVIGSCPVGDCSYDTALYDLPNCTAPSRWNPMAVDGEPCHDPRLDGTRAAPGEILLEVVGSREVWSSSSQRRCARSANGARLDDSSEALRIIELVCIVLFTTELVVRCLTFSVAVSLSDFILDPINISDIVTVAPWYIELGLAASGNAVDTDFLQLVRTVRLLRVSQLMRLATHFQQANILVIATRRSRVVIGLIFVVVTVFSLVLGALMYAVEMGSYVALADFASGGGVVDDSGATLSIDSASSSCALDVCGQNVREDRAISPFESIPLAMYWALVTMTTVGYGDMIGLSPAGYAIGTATIIVGSIFLSLPIAVFSTEFEESSREIKRRQKIASIRGETSRRQEQLAERITTRTGLNKLMRLAEAQILDLLDEMRSRGLVPDEISYSSVINACAKGGESQRALDLFDEMRSRGLVPDATTYGAALNACAIGRQPDRALSLFESLQREALTPELSHWSHLLDAIGPNHAQLRSLLLRMVEQPVFAGAESIEAGVPKLDLHGLSAGAAEMVARWWLLHELPQRLAAGKMSEPTHVVLVTGHGESRVLKEASVVKQRVLELAGELGTVVEQSNRGCVVLAWPLTGGGNASMV